jgi:hypothetical protein
LDIVYIIYLVLTLLVIHCRVEGGLGSTSTLFVAS